MDEVESTIIGVNAGAASTGFVTRQQQALVHSESLESPLQDIDARSTVQRAHTSGIIPAIKHNTSSALIIGPLSLLIIDN